MTKEENKQYDLTIVGGGIVGLATAFKLQKAYPHLRVLVIEKEKKLAEHQTGHNSGVIHSGLYYKPGSYKAKNCVEGRRELVAFARTHKVAHDVCGKVVVALNDAEVPYLYQLFDRGMQNEVEGIEKIDGDQIREIEPFCAGVKGIWVPCTGIIDFRGMTEKLAELIPLINSESRILKDTKVLDLVKKEGQTELITTNGKFTAKHVIYCGGLHSDRLAKMDGAKNLGMRIVGFRGDYYELSEQGLHKVKNLIYPVPDPAFPFLGVHFTRMIEGGIECGPNAVFTFKREGYGKLDFNLKDSWNALTYRGTWKLFLRHWKFGLGEYRRAFSKRLFHKQVQKLIPSLTMEDLEPGRSGVRAMALDGGGEMIDDFRIEYLDHSIHVLNAPSPAATSALAIGEEVRKMADKHFGLQLSTHESGN